MLSSIFSSSVIFVFENVAPRVRTLILSRERTGAISAASEFLRIEDLSHPSLLPVKLRNFPGMRPTIDPIVIDSRVQELQIQFALMLGADNSQESLRINGLSTVKHAIERRLDAGSFRRELYLSPIRTKSV
ncbi:uncharacterized protein LOC122532371 [Frieseomelitta varia]|uniref:uncharacterized protein LOC122532371 n=1 Tax=Frieseomelitta varia TaxID=561572 RepID=UPI001CB6AC61|nr:uncharacterized protein LOC122532371 [Frieseomelitta varia]